MTKKIIFVIGIFGVGKSYVCSKFMEKHPEYKLMNTTQDIDSMIKEIQNDPCEYWIGDYYLNQDPLAKKMREALGGEFEFWIIFDKPEVITSRQLASKPEMVTTAKDCWLVREVYTEHLIHLYDLPGTKFMNSDMREFSKDTFLELFDAFYMPPCRTEVKEFLDQVNNTKQYDKHYHNFELPHGFKLGNDAPNGKEAYARNELTWEVIKDIFDWKNKTVLDLCGFHFYFSQQIYKSGGLPVATDRHIDAIHTGGVLAKWANTKFHIYHYDIDKHVDKEGFTAFPPTRHAKPTYDLIMLFNVLHHLTHKDRLLKSIAKRAPKALFEINKGDLGLIHKYFDIVVQKESPKDNRWILLCNSKNV